jgi:protease-4
VRRLLLSGLALGLGLALSCSPRPRKSHDPGSPEPGPHDRRLVEFDLSSGFPEASKSALFQMPAARSYTGLVRSLERALDDSLTAGVLVRLGPQAVDYARAEELGELLGRFRKKGLSVVCHAHGFSNASSWLVARGCSRIWLSAAGSVESVGIAAELLHMKGLLDRLKIEVQFLAIGRYKSAAEALTRESPSEDAREALGSTLGSIRESWLTGAESGRPGKELDHKLEEGPYSPEEAKNAGIIDAVGFESEARAEAKRLAKTSLTSHAFGSGSGKDGGFDVGSLIRLLASGDEEGDGKPHIAVLPAEGAIGMESGGPLDGPGITAQALNRTIKRLAADDSVKAVVLRIDSPGGSPLASDLIWHELMELRKKKPVIASVGSMAASGGYYIACAAQKIVAPRTSIVGSIGVFGGKVVVGPALHQFGVDAFPVPANPDPNAGARATYLSPFTPWDEATRVRVRATMQSIYDLFIARVAESRKLPNDAVRGIAEGRIWSGAQGRDRGLVDELGGLSTALDLARKLSGLGRDASVTVEGGRESLLEMLLVGDDASSAEIRAAMTRFEHDHALLSELPKELRASAATLGPLFHGEHVVAALPFALDFK